MLTPLIHADKKIAFDLILPLPHVTCSHSPSPTIVPLNSSLTPIKANGGLNLSPGPRIIPRALLGLVWSGWLSVYQICWRQIWSSFLEKTTAVTFKICQNLSAVFRHHNNNLALVLRVCEILTFISEKKSCIQAPIKASKMSVCWCGVCVCVSVCVYSDLFSLVCLFGFVLCLMRVFSSGWLTQSDGNRLCFSHVCALKAFQQGDI